MTAAARVPAAFARAYPGEPTVVWAAPGRVNLIGEHTDYNDGFVLPFALPLRTAVAAAKRSAPEWTVWSESTEDEVSFTEADLVPGRVRGWAGYVAGVVWALRENGIEVPGARLAVCSDVPLGAGLSSSAALECAILAALLDLATDAPAQTPLVAGLTKTELAKTRLAMARWPAVAQQAENSYVGVPTGIMDQSAATLCRAGHALFLDCRTAQVEQVPLDLIPAGLTVLIVDTRAPHRHDGGEYAARRAACAAAARTLGVPALRDVSNLDAALAALPDDLSRRRVRHVVTENARVLETVALLRAGQPEAIGPVLTASHASMRDDYEITVAQVDLAVDTALGAGALGARMTGGGFGGCVIALVRTAAATDVAEAVAKAFAGHGFTAPVAFVATPGPGASRVY